MIIAFSGKKRSGKDTSGLIVQTLLAFPKADNETVIKYLDAPLDNPDWEIKKFAGYLKKIVADLTSCTLEQLENESFKNEKVYTKYLLCNDFLKTRKEFENVEEGLAEYNMLVERYIKTEYDTIEAINDNIIYEEIEITRRDMLKTIGADIARTIHSNIWIDELFNSYNVNADKKPKWLITDVRFPNEAKAVTERGGILIRINRPLFVYKDSLVIYQELQSIYFEDTGEYIDYEYAEKFRYDDPHPSETALDDYDSFDYIVHNIQDINYLINKLRTILKINGLL